MDVPFPVICRDAADSGLRSQHGSKVTRRSTNHLTSDGGASDANDDGASAASPSDADANADASGAPSEPVRAGDDRPRFL
jgi:hypothetical protein